MTTPPISRATRTTRKASFARVITFDKRGTGLSDRVADAPSYEQRMDERVTALVAFGAFARVTSAPDYPIGSKGH